MTKIIKLVNSDIESILNVENNSFIPSIQANKETILDRLNKGHTYLGATQEGKLIGAIAFRFAHFSPDFSDFKIRQPTFEEWANEKSDSEGNAIFAYSLGVIPKYRSGIISKKLLKKTIEMACDCKKEFLVGDGRIPSYNGSNENGFENFHRNEALREAINKYLKNDVVIPRDILSQDPIVGLYMKLIPELKILGVTDSKFIEEDYPAGGHRVIVYVDLQK